MTVGDRLPSRVDGPHEAGSEHDGIEAELEKLKQPDPGVAGLANGLGERVAHLPLAEVVLGPKPLLLDQLLLIAADLAAGSGTMLPRWIRPALHDPSRLRGKCNAQLPSQSNFGSTTSHDNSPNGASRLDSASTNK
jgi:hypothetical protein